MLSDSVSLDGGEKELPVHYETSGVQLRPLVVTLWRKMHEVLFTQAMTDGTKITSVWVS